MEQSLNKFDSPHPMFERPNQSKNSFFTKKNIPLFIGLFLFVFFVGFMTAGISTSIIAAVAGGTISALITASILGFVWYAAGRENKKIEAQREAEKVKQKEKKLILDPYIQSDIKLTPIDDETTKYEYNIDDFKRLNAFQENALAKQSVKLTYNNKTHYKIDDTIYSIFPYNHNRMLSLENFIKKYNEYNEQKIVNPIEDPNCNLEKLKEFKNTLEHIRTMISQKQNKETSDAERKAYKLLTTNNILANLKELITIAENFEKLGCAFPFSNHQHPSSTHQQPIPRYQWISIDLRQKGMPTGLSIKYARNNLDYKTNKEKLVGKQRHLNITSKTTTVPTEVPTADNIKSTFATMILKRKRNHTFELTFVDDEAKQAYESLKTRLPEAFKGFTEKDLYRLVLAAQDCKVTSVTKTCKISM